MLRLQLHSIVLTVFFLVSAAVKADEEETKTSPLATALCDRIAECVTKYHREAKTTIKTENRLTKIAVEWEVREFMIHTITKSGAVSKEAFREKGPGDEGFILEVKLPQAGFDSQQEGFPYGEKRDIYWSLFRNKYQIKEPRCPELGRTLADETKCGVIRARMSYGAWTDRKLMRQLHEILCEYGNPAVDFEVKRPPPKLD